MSSGKLILALLLFLHFLGRKRKIEKKNLSSGNRNFVFWHWLIGLKAGWGAYLVAHFVENSKSMHWWKKCQQLFNWNTTFWWYEVDFVSLILDGCIEPKNFCQILNFRLVGIGVFEGIKRYFVVNHATPETGARPITIILETEWIRVRKS